MRSLTFLFLLIAAITTNAQEGIKFNQTTTWNDTKAKAAAERKLIFLDCYTSWCAPCKWMDKNVFTVPAVANFYNENFINAKIDMEKGEGIELRKKYAVQSFPTFLFINDKGEVVHRTASKMSVEEFLEEGKKAANPTTNLSYLSAKYTEGTRDLPFLLDYVLVLNKSDRMKAEQIGKDIINGISEKELRTEFGWKTIKALARTENDKLGAYFIANESAFNNWSKPEEREQLKDRLVTSTMYGLMSGKNEKAFMEKLSYFKSSEKIDRRKQGIMLEADFYLGAGRTADYVKITKKALKNELKDDAEKLSFLARRASGSKGDNNGTAPKAIQKQAYLMAKRAVVLEPEEYSIQSTFAHVCLAMKNKPEALAAAKKSRLLADAETSKIQKLAQDLLDRVEAL
ncbi:thioredoxin family protein [Pedobacter nyackensis]|uniref:Thioredoxin-like n=1 Tax=Pedobacter nyackensis TaxID=475255 RepID=A0A1W2ACF1_9SPHI|nr:thioredoxin family protein [Pedobacter nyackensis]SMC58399.1 Thioredoxin-like [Pedobacter nyackensis]